MKKVLIIAWHFPPIGGPGTQRTLKYCKYLPANGWSPTVIAGIEPEEHQDPSMLAELPDEMVVERYAIPQTLWRRCRRFLFKIRLGRVANFLGGYFDFPDTRREWALAMVAHAERLHKEHQFDLIYTTGYWFSTYLTGKHAKAKLGIPWVADIRDPWATNEVLFGHLSRGMRKRHFRAEQDMVMQADATVVAHPVTEEDLIQRYPQKAAGISCITNGYDPDDFPALADPNPVHGDDSVRIVHTGTFYGLYTPEPFFDVLKELSAMDANLNLTCTFLGGVGDAVVPEIPGVRFEILPRSDHAEAVRAQRSADVLLIAFTDSSGTTHIPGKLFEYLAAQIPIFAVVPELGATADLIHATNTGWVADCNAPTAGAQELKKAIESIQAPDVTFSPNRNLIETFERPRLAGALAQVFVGVTKSNP